MTAVGKSRKSGKTNRRGARAGARNGKSLQARALAAMEFAYAPYSRFRVGAALLGDDGSVTEACNVENAAFPAGTCAERAAISAAVAKGVRKFTVLAIASTADDPTPPCGMCRQALIEFAPELEIISVTRSGKETRWRLTELLPQAFLPTSLEHTTE